MRLKRHRKPKRPQFWTQWEVEDYVLKLIRSQPWFRPMVAQIIRSHELRQAVVWKPTRVLQVGRLGSDPSDRIDQSVPALEQIQLHVQQQESTRSPVVVTHGLAFDPSEN